MHLMGVSISLKNSVRILRERGIGRGCPVQKYIAASAIRRMRKYTPQAEGIMADCAYAAKGGTEIRQFTPYARKQYEEEQYHHRGIETHHWFDAMKQNGGAANILREAVRRAGAKGVK